MGSTKTKGSAPHVRAKPGRDTPEDRRHRASTRREEVGRVAADLRTVLRDGRFSLEDLLSVFAEDAIDRGWIELDANGYAVASLPATRFVSQVSEDAPNRWERVAELREKDGAFVASSIERRNERAGDDREVTALNAALRIPAVQHATLSALGVEFVLPGGFEAQEAGDLAADCAMVAHGLTAGVPEGMLDRVAPVVSRLRIHKVATWEAALITSVAAAMTVRERHSGRRLVDLTLETLKSLASEGVPRAFLSPSDEQITRATKLLRTLQLAKLKPEHRPKRAPGDRGRPLSDQGAAAAFARCFGVTMERKESRRRRRKT